MAHPRIRKGLIKLRNRANWKIKIGAAAASIVLILGAVWWLSLPLPQNYETEIRIKPNTYSVVPGDSSCTDGIGCRIQLKFSASNPAQNAVPEYTISEDPANAKTIITFDRVLKIDGEFDYNQIISSPLIDSINYDIKNKQFVIEINRKGDYLPARISIDKNLATIILPPPTADYPSTSNFVPADNSAAFPALHPISFDAVLKNPLKSATVFFQGKPVEFETATTTEGNYHFSFSQTLEIDQEYSVKAIVTDFANLTVVSTWTFTGQIPSAAVLGKDRFKYLGWWGEINTNGVAVRKDTSIASDRLGTFSSANRAKVIKEVYGEWVDGKNLWYQIDGGMYPGAYVFSDYVTPMAQPQPVQNFTIPEGVVAGQNWIDVDLTKKVLTLLKYDKPLFATYISPGRDENPTQPGTFRVWYKLTKAEMKGGPPLHSYKYDLKNIPWTMFYNYDYAVHGTYWHDKFGTPQSAGCTNMTQGDAKYIFDNTLPAIPEGKESAVARDETGKGTGTVVHNHK